MANISKLKMTQDKRRAISRQITAQREVLSALEAQERDLETAERVLTALELESVPEIAPEREQSPEIETPPAERPTGKPEGIPTMPEMIVEALKDANARGLR